MLELRNVLTYYGNIQALHDVSVEIKRGNRHPDRRQRRLQDHLADDALWRTQAQQRQHLVRGEQIDSLSTARIMRKDIAVVPEGRRIFARLTVQENLLMGAFFVDKAEQPALLDQVFTMFPRLHERLEQRAGTMSGGEQQMLAIGRALMSKPRLLLLDEPSLGWPPSSSSRFRHHRAAAPEGDDHLPGGAERQPGAQAGGLGYVLENGRVVLQDTGRPCSPTRQCARPISAADHEQDRGRAGQTQLLARPCPALHRGAGGAGWPPRLLRQAQPRPLLHRRHHLAATATTSTSGAFRRSARVPWC